MTTIAQQQPAFSIASDLGQLSKDPYLFVKYAFPWGQDELEDFDGPEDWQKDVLLEIAHGLRTPDQVIREAAASGHGVGKSALVAWLILWSLSTFEDARGVVTANTDTQLRTKTWPELAKWHNLFIAKDLFSMTATSIYSSDKAHEKTWRFDLIPWNEQKTESFAGLHNKGRRILVIFDEASAIPNAIWEVTEGALTDKKTQIIWCVFGNPTRNTGRFKDCFSKYRHLWNTHRVDSRNVGITNKAQLTEWVDTYGEDSDFIKVRVKGDFPAVGEAQFIPTPLVEAAKGKHLDASQYSFAPTIIGVDPGWSIDEGVIYLRQGLRSKQLMVYRGVKDDMTIAGYIARFEKEYEADGVFIDLGYGTGIFSVGKNMGRNWQLVAFGGESTDKGYLNKRVDMWRKMREWLAEGGALPDDPVICDELIAPEAHGVTTGKNMGKLVLESKEDMKKRGIASPNRADALALTFAFPVLSKSQKQFHKLSATQKGNEYNPLDRQPATQQAEYDPLSAMAQVPGKPRTWRDLVDE